MTQTIPVFFTTDDYYAPYLSVALHSLINHISDDKQYDIIILHDVLSDENQKHLAEVERANVSVCFFKMTDYFVNEVKTDKNKLRADYVTFTIYFRLFIAEMFPHLDKALYLDADTIINADLADLYHIDLEDQLIAAVHDNFISANVETRDYVTDALGIPVLDYVNSGVLVMNLKTLREVNFVQHFLDLLNRYHIESIAADQDYLNVLCHGRILYLDAKWNTMMADGSQGPDHPKIIHFNLFGKPWHYPQAPNASYFWRYARLSSYYEELIRVRDNFTETEVNSDERKKRKLIDHALSIPHQSLTFKKLTEEGVKVRL